MESSEPTIEDKRKNAEMTFNIMWKHLVDRRYNGVFEDMLYSPLLPTMLQCELRQKLAANRINELLKRQSSKNLVLEVLSECLHHFSLQVINAYASSWIPHCLKCHDSDKALHLTVLTSIIRHSQNNPHFNRLFVADFLSPTLTFILMNTDNQIVERAQMECLIVCLENFCSSCNAFKTRIDNHIPKYLSSNCHILVYLGSIAFFYSQHIGNAGKDGDCHKDAVTISFKKLCATCHMLYSRFLEHQIEFEQNNFNQEIEPFNISLEPANQPNVQAMDRFQHIKIVLNNSMNWLGLLIEKNTFKTVFPKELLDVIKRGMSVHVCMDVNDSTMDMSLVAAYLKDIQMSCLKLLEALIDQMKSQLAPFNYTISKIITDIITRGQACNCYIDSKQIQRSVLNVFLKWINTGMCILTTDCRENLISSLISSAFVKNIEIESREFHENLCLQSLIILFIVLDSGDELPPALGNSLLLSLIEAALSIQNGNSVFPFNDECEIYLYKIMCCLAEKESIKALPPITILLQILHVGSKHVNPDVSSICKSLLNIGEKICQPASSSMDIAEEGLRNVETDDEVVVID